MITTCSISQSHGVPQLQMLASGVSVGNNKSVADGVEVVVSDVGAVGLTTFVGTGVGIGVGEMVEVGDGLAEGVGVAEGATAGV